MERFPAYCGMQCGLPLALVLEGGYGPSHQDAIAAIFSSLRGIPFRERPERPARRHATSLAILKKMAM